MAIIIQSQSQIWSRQGAYNNACHKKFSTMLYVNYNDILSPKQVWRTCGRKVRLILRYLLPQQLIFEIGHLYSCLHTLSGCGAVLKQASIYMYLDIPQLAHGFTPCSPSQHQCQLQLASQLEAFVHRHQHPLLHENIARSSWLCMSVVLENET